MEGEEQCCGCTAHWKRPLCLLLASAELENVFIFTTGRSQGEGVALK